MWNVAAGSLGILLQSAIFVVTVLVVAKNGSVSRGLVYGGVLSVYGYALANALLALLRVPWQVSNVVMSTMLAFALVVGPLRRVALSGVSKVLRAVRMAPAAVAVLVLMLLFVITIAIVEPELSIDGQLYHGPALANFVQSGLWGWSTPNQYLYYSDLTIAGGVNLATFTGATVFDDGLQIPHLLLLAFIVNWALTVRFSSAFVRVSMAVLIAASPVIWLQPRILYVDLAYGVAVAGAIILAVTVHDVGWFDVLVAGVLVGAVFATKPTGLLTGLVLLVVLVGVVIARQYRTATRRSTVRVVLVGFVPPLVAAMAFYARNLILFANPVYPIQVTLGPLRMPGILDVSIFASGERGSGFVDPGRWVSYARSIASGIVNGVTKLDYDPRSGGYGVVPLLLIALVAALVIAQVASTRLYPRLLRLKHWKAQVGIIAISATILLLQPSTFDTRYVIGPTVALLTALLLTSVAVIPAVAELAVGVIALMSAAGQITWTERTMFPGVAVAVAISKAPPSEQANTPANPWGPGIAIAWLPRNPAACQSIAVETSGGLTASGMHEPSFLGTLSYGLYGSALCNRVAPITLSRLGTGADAATVADADYVVIYANEFNQWTKAYPTLAKCLSQVYSIPGTSDYPQAELVLNNSCPTR